MPRAYNRHLRLSEISDITSHYREVMMQSGGSQQTIDNCQRLTANFRF